MYATLPVLTAKALGLDGRRPCFARADEVIE
jgi:hypothetical protein